MDKTLEIFGHKIQIQQNTTNSAESKANVRKAIETLKEYKKGKENLEQKIIENERWYKSQHWDIIRTASKTGEPEPTTAYLFSVLSNKHADAMDNYPVPNIVEREQTDVKEANTLSSIVPVVLERNRFRKTWNRGWWYKLKQGFCVYGVFWNNELEQGLGDISIKRLDALNVYWEPGIEDLEDSRNVFVIDLIDIDILEEEHPELKGKITQDAQLKPKEYVQDDSIDTTNKAVIVDWYYKKKNSQGQMVLHLTKFVGEYKLASTEDDENTKENGLYEHGYYPLFIDVLFPEEGTPTGFGFIDIVRNPQIYIDKLDQIITKNAYVAGKERYLISKDLGINMDDLSDLSKDFVEFEGTFDERKFHSFQAKPIQNFIVQHRENKINELKETANNNDFDRGQGGKGVTAAAAIQALQEAANKVSRDIIADSYDTYSDMVYMCIELIGQFYTEDRKFRIEGPQGEANYITYNNQNLQPQALKAFETEGMIQNPEWNSDDENSQQFIDDPEYQPKYRKPIFDIKVKPERNNPFSRAALNEMAKEFFMAGMFNPQRASESQIALEMMTFEGKEKILAKIQENGTLFEQMQQMKQTMDKMAMVIEKTTGRKLQDINQQGMS